MPQELVFDFETFSEADLPSVGASRYARHPSTEVLMCGYAFDDEPVKIWVPVEGERLPADLEDAWRDPTVTKIAWNKPFEYSILKHVEGIEVPHDQWRDPMVLSLALSLPGKLEKACQVVNLPLDFQKDVNGKALMRWFSMLRPATKRLPVRRVHWHEKQDKWDDFKAYCVQDVEAERAFWKRMRPYDLPNEEWELWAIDQEINEAGIPFDRDFAEHADSVKDALIEARLKEMARLTGLSNPNSRDQLLPWLQEHGYPYDDMVKGHIRRFSEKLEAEMAIGGTAEWQHKLLKVLRLRLDVGQAAVKKFGALASHGDEDGCLRNTLQFYGAGRTGRWGGRVFQPQNLVKPNKKLDGLEWEAHEDGIQEVVGGSLIDCYEAVAKYDAEELDLLYDNPMDMLSACVRPTVQAPDGYVLLDADLKAIENVVIGWLADDRKILGVFEQGRDPYIDFGQYMVNRPYDELWEEYKKGNKSVRTLSKPPVLGCGFGLSAGYEFENKKTGEMEATGLLGYARNMNVEMTPEQAQHAVSVWRATYKDVVNLWYEMEKAAFRCMKTKKPVRAGRVVFDRKGPFLRMTLPSGRPLHYCRPKLKMKMMPWGEEKLSLVYEGLDDRNQWDEIKTYGAKLVENATQATACDLLRHAIRLAKRRGIDIRLHIHDQIIALVRAGRAVETLKLLIRCMTETPDWAEGMPVGAAGHISRWLVKD